jgi:hypothetical protein
MQFFSVATLHIENNMESATPKKDYKLLQSRF